jgi:two-component system, NtrC family, sensor kinase
VNGTVLIVDDSLTVRMDLADAFERAGFHSLPCANAYEARQSLAREAIALVILDVVLPDVDGVELLKELRDNSATRDLPILMLSTEAEVKDRIRGLQTGADDYVGKPYDTGYVIARGRELVRRHAGWLGQEPATVLVIDDSTTFREGLREALEGMGYAVVTASNGEEGLQLAAARRPGAIIVDGVMPGIDGVTVIRKIRLDAALRGTPCVLLTASEDYGAELRALDAGADIFVRKEEDVEVILARLGAALRSAPTQRADAASLVGPKRVLAVDDSMTYLHELAGMLRGEGYDVVLARSGEEAIEMVAVQSVDCILLDLLMPGMDGKETCRRLKASRAIWDIPVIMLTALEDRGAMIEGLSTGADDYISKSSDFDVLKARVQAQIRRKQFEDENRRIREELLRSELQASEERAARQLAETRAALVGELERKNKELEAFSYSVSHDLRAPLRSIDGFSQALLEDHAESLDETGRHYLYRVRDSVQRMAELIDDLLQLSRVSLAELRHDRVNLSAAAQAVVEELQRSEPERKVEVQIQPSLSLSGDARLMRVLLENLIGNAWKFTAKASNPSIEVGSEKREAGTAFFVRDNGAGFDMAYAEKLFRPFQRLHGADEFPGTGIGLATVYRIVDRHGGRVWAEAGVGRGATIYFSVGSPRFGAEKSVVPQSATSR